jgi:primosomal protein N' (replication factor Y)
MGTESLEKLVGEQFPTARVLRWDTDSTRYKGAHDLILDHFINHRADILIGTQMLAKGLDLPLVTLVGVVLADISVNLPDFRAPERTFQLLTQVAGRAGRSALGGRVILQTFNPENYAIKSAAAYDFAGFNQTELSNREKLGYPPFSRIFKLEFRHTNASRLETEVIAFGQQLNQWIAQDNLHNLALIGPAPCFYERRSGLFRWQILLRGTNPSKLLELHPITWWQLHGIDVDLIVDPTNLL